MILWVACSPCSHYRTRRFIELSKHRYVRHEARVYEKQWRVTMHYQRSEGAWLEENSGEGRVERLQSFISLCRVTAAFFLFLTLSEHSHHPEGLELVPVIMTLHFLTVVVLRAKRQARLLSCLCHSWPMYLGIKIWWSLWFPCNQIVRNYDSY
jgi:hypothetical protein